MIHTLFQCGIAPVDAWSKLQQVPHSNSLMSIMTRYIQKPDRGDGANQAVQLPEG